MSEHDDWCCLDCGMTFEQVDLITPLEECPSCGSYNTCSIKEQDDNEAENIRDQILEDKELFR